MFPIMIPIRDLRTQLSAVSNDVFRMAAELGNMKEPLTQSVYRVIIPSIAMNFVLGGRPKWKNLTADTIRIRGSAKPILIDERLLHKAAVSKTIWKISDTEANMDRIDQRVPYAKYHQDGTVNMPQRQFAILQDKDVDNIVEIFRQWLDNVAVDQGNWPRGLS